MDEGLKLYIPLGVKPEAELFTGFGKKQLFQSIVGSLVMGGIAALAWLFTGNVTTTVILVLAGIFGSVMMRLSGVTATTSICPAATSFRIRP